MSNPIDLLVEVASADEPIDDSEPQETDPDEVINPEPVTVLHRAVSFNDIVIDELISEANQSGTNLEIFTNDGFRYTYNVETKELIKDKDYFQPPGILCEYWSSRAGVEFPVKSKFYRFNRPLLVSSCSNPALDLACPYPASQQATQCSQYSELAAINLYETDKLLLRKREVSSLIEFYYDIVDKASGEIISGAADEKRAYDELVKRAGDDTIVPVKEDVSFNGYLAQLVGR